MFTQAAYRAQAKFHASLIANAPAQLHQVGDVVRMDDEVGVVESFDAGSVVLGNRGHYQVRITGGRTIFGKPAKVGEVRRFLHSNVHAATWGQ